MKAKFDLGDRVRVRGFYHAAIQLETAQRYPAEILKQYLPDYDPANPKSIYRALVLANQPGSCTTEDTGDKCMVEYFIEEALKVAQAEGGSHESEV